MINYSLIWCSYNSRERFSGFALNQKYFCEETLVLLGKGKNKAVCKQSCKRRSPSPMKLRTPWNNFLQKATITRCETFLWNQQSRLTQKRSDGAAERVVWTGISFNFPPDWVEKVCGLESVEGETHWKLQSGIRLKREDDTGNLLHKRVSLSRMNWQGPAQGGRICVLLGQKRVGKTVPETSFEDGS